MATDEEAKAVQEVAKATGKALEVAEKAGPFLERAFGPLVENAVGIVSDRLAYYRLVQFYRLVDKVKAILERRGISEVRHVAPKVALPLLEAATIEEDEGLHDLWANLLANAMDPNAEQARRSFIGILEEFEPSDAKVLLFVYRGLVGGEQSGVILRLAEGLNAALIELATHLELPDTETELSLLNLDRLGCIKLNIQYASDGVQSLPRTDRVHFTLTALGKALAEASMK